MINFGRELISVLHVQRAWKYKSKGSGISQIESGECFINLYR